MDTMSAYARALAAKGQPLKVFDWNRAAEFIRERRPSEASAGLGSDWEWTGGVIYRSGGPVPREQTYTYLASIWATPELRLDDETLPCWKYAADTDGWDAGTYWPESALAILRQPESA